MVIKAELHCHVEGAAHPELVARKAREHNMDVSDIIHPDHGYIWSDFTGFLKAYDKAASMFTTPDDYVDLACDYLQRLADDECIYCELFASPDHAARIGCSFNTLIDAIAEGMGKAKASHGIEGRIIVVGVRHAGVEPVVNAARMVAREPHPLVTGFGMAGDERIGRQQDFKLAFEIAGEAGLGLTTHAGEFGGAESVRDAIDHLGVRRIGHGVRSIEDVDLVKRLADEEIVLEVCPGSNIALGVYSDFAGHPFRKLDEAGCIVTLNSDDPPHFHTSLAREYELAVSKFGYGEADLLRFTKNALNAAFVDGETRAKLLERCVMQGLV